ncbi:semaphorin-4A [Excalfactoria chinensis]|uniref:semaphorin-4A n=1 Tax=Excalfactoria chinensis TaxID=46218 RepID=UPI003B3B8B7B
MLRLPLWAALLPALLLRAQLPPRVSIPAGDPRRSVRSFSSPSVRHCDALLLGPDESLLYVGARDAVLALNVTDPTEPQLVATVPWGPTEEKKRECSFKRKSPETECFNFIRVLVALNRSHLYACGTNAFSPACTHILLENFTLPRGAVGLRDGKGQSPFYPRHSHTALMDGGELYAATANNFHGTEPVISRSLGARTALKTDAFLRWLADDASFVASAAPPDDDQVYFFFEETAQEFNFIERLRVPRVGRVCKSDVGGDKVLQKKWTTFLKAQLQCGPPGSFPYNHIRHAAAAPPAARNGRNHSEFYAVFNARWSPGSALCSYGRAALRAAFEGRFLEREKDSAQWSARSAPGGGPRPGSCSVGSSSDQALSFMKDHFLMEARVAPTHGRPLLLSPASYTHIAVHQTRGAAGTTYRVLLMATAEGFLHKAVEVAEGRAHIVESIQMFEQPQRVSSVLLSASKAVLFVGHEGGVLVLPLSNCSQHQNCAECVLARDPDCAWSSRDGACRRVGEHGGDGTWLQDVEGGDAGSRCYRGRSRGAEMGAPEMTLIPAARSLLRLPCPQRSAWASYSWEQPVSARGHTEQLPDLTLLVAAQRHSAGTYTCWATENSVRWAVVRYRLQEPSDAAAPSGSYWAQFVAVAVLLALTLPTAAGLALVAYRARSKVRGCGTAGGGAEKAPLNGGGSGAAACRWTAAPSGTAGTAACGDGTAAERGDGDGGGIWGDLASPWEAHAHSELSLAAPGRRDRRPFLLRPEARDRFFRHGLSPSPRWRRRAGADRRSGWLDALPPPPPPPLTSGGRPEGGRKRRRPPWGGGTYRAGRKLVGSGAEVRGDGPGEAGGEEGPGGAGRNRDGGGGGSRGADMEPGRDHVGRGRRLDGLDGLVRLRADNGENAGRPSGAAMRGETGRGTGRTG